MKALLITAMLVMVAVSGSANAPKAQTRRSGKSTAVAYCATYQYVGPVESGETYAQTIMSGYRHQGLDPRLPMLYKGL
jgi:hypothetical protein